MNSNEDWHQTLRKVRFHRKVFKVKPESTNKVKRAQKASKKYYKWMVEEKPKKRSRLPQLNKHLGRRVRSNALEPIQHEEMGLFEANQRAVA